MKNRHLIEAYRQERRALEIPNYVREDLGSVVRYSPNSSDSQGIVCFTRIPEPNLVDEIRRQVAWFESRNLAFEWKVYDSDEPKSLKKYLLEAGFEEGEPEALMVYELENFQPDARPEHDGVEVRRIDSMETLRQVVEFQEEIWRMSFGWLFDQLCAAWGTAAFYAAYQDRHLLGTGWIEYPQGSQFAELHGGGVLPSFRGRGIYSRLFEVRMMDALARGLKWVAVDAAPMSRPILEAKGFERLDSTWPMVWSPGARP